MTTAEKTHLTEAVETLRNRAEACGRLADEYAAKWRHSEDSLDRQTLYGLWRGFQGKAEAFKAAADLIAEEIG